MMVASAPASRCSDIELSTGMLGRSSLGGHCCQWCNSTKGFEDYSNRACCPSKSKEDGSDVRTHIGSKPRKRHPPTCPTAAVRASDHAEAQAHRVHSAEHVLRAD